MFYKLLTSRPLTCIRKQGLSTSPRSTSAVGFIGLGNMGRGMAKNLLEKGNLVVAFDTNANTMAEAVKLGVVAAKGPNEVAAKSSSILTMLPNNDAVIACYTEPGGILEGVQPGALLIDSSTIDPAVSRAMSEAASAKGAIFVDAPVSGGVNAAAAGTLTFMVGADKDEHFAAAQKILAHMGKSITHCGQVGTGQAVKICNNMLLAISMIGVSETMNLGINLGLDPKLLASILGSATGRCWSVDTYNPVPGVLPNVPSSNNYQGGFGSALMLKDLGLAQDAANRTGSATPLGSLSLQMYRIMCNAGFAGKDFSSAFQFIKNSPK